jgi:hypothetical protein
MDNEPLLGEIKAICWTDYLENIREVSNLTLVIYLLLICCAE